MACLIPWLEVLARGVVVSSTNFREAEFPQSFSVVLDGVTHRVACRSGDTLLDCILAAGEYKENKSPFP